MNLPLRRPQKSSLSLFLNHTLCININLFSSLIQHFRLNYKVDKGKAKILHFFLKSNQRNDMLFQTWLSPSPRNYNTSPQGHFVTLTHGLTVIDLEGKDNTRSFSITITVSPRGLSQLGCTEEPSSPGETANTWRPFHMLALQQVFYKLLCCSQ